MREEGCEAITFVMSFGFWKRTLEVGSCGVIKMVKELKRCGRKGA